MGRYEIVTLIGMLMIALVVGVIGSSVAANLAVSSKVQTKWVVEGELQQHNKPSSPSTFWVNGVRLTIEDRPDFYTWMEQQVGKDIEIVVRTR